MNDENKLRKEARLLLFVLIAGLVFSGVTAFPIQTELNYARQLIGYLDLSNALTLWIENVHQGVNEVNTKYPFISYGTDWLAFAHLILGVLFIGVVKDPVRNIWVLQFGLIACIAIFPLALIAGSIRGIPFFWQLIDCSFGLAGGIVLWMCYRRVKKIEMVRARA